jgi:hypothetical protein
MLERFASNQFSDIMSGNCHFKETPMSKTWDEMSQSEKIEDLRRDVVRLFDAYNDLSRRLAAAGTHLGRIETIATEAAKSAEELKARLSTEGE